MLHFGMPKKPLTRAFKTAWFSKAARKAGIGEPRLIAAIREVMQGQADTLGGGVFKKRLNKNMHRSILFAKGGRHWIVAYLFATKDRANIDGDELAVFKKLAHTLGRVADSELASALNQGDLLGARPSILFPAVPTVAACKPSEGRTVQPPCAAPANASRCCGSLVFRLYKPRALPDRRNPPGGR